MKLRYSIFIPWKKFPVCRSVCLRFAFLFGLSLYAILFGDAAWAVATSDTGCSVWIDRSAPTGLVEKIPDGCERVYARDRAGCSVEIAPTDSAGKIGEGTRLFAAAAPFPTISDEIYFEGIRQSWLGLCPENGCQSVFYPKAYRKTLTALFGGPPSQTVRAIDGGELLKATWGAANTVAIVPFDDLDPRWKVLGLRLSEEDVSDPFAIDFDPEAYPLKIRYRVTELRKGGCPGTLKLTTNYDPSRLTTVTLTGTTALSRRLAAQIETEGTDFPISEIAESIRKSDLAHVSSEASFFSGCPSGIPLRHDPKFCARPGYFRVLTALGVDIVELTGNHNLDWGPQAFIDAYGLFQRAGMKTYGGGLTLFDARAPLLVEHNGNRFAFSGCNSVGPDSVWATKETPGAAPCDYDELIASVKELSREGYFPIVTFQQVEHDFYSVPTIQFAAFYHLAQAGATIVSGSQAHIPQGFGFIGDHFMHFGLGNFLFDQTSYIERDSFFDRHYFYNGKYLGVRIETIRRNDDMKIEFLTGVDRAELLKTVFSYSYFNRTFKP